MRVVSEHPAASIILYTITIAGATWAASTFILQDQKVSLLQDRVELYKEKATLLEREVIKIQEERNYLRDLLAGDPSSYPALNNQIKVLSLRLRNCMMPEEGGVDDYRLSDTRERIQPGQVLKREGAILRLIEIHEDRTIDLIIELPGKGEEAKEGVKEGAIWAWETPAGRVAITVADVNWLGGDVLVYVDSFAREN